MVVSHENQFTNYDKIASDYQLLIGHNRTDGSHKSDEQLRMEYIHLTDKLILEILTGNASTEGEPKPYDAVIFLDKSARPVAWLMRELWQKLATDKDGNTPPMPACHFLNIDREQWVNMVDPHGVGRMDIDKVDHTTIRSLRSIFISPTQKQDGLTDNIDVTRSALDGRVILIVDEVMSSGRTLDIATKMVMRAFPTAHVGSTYWMGGVATKNKGLAVGNADLPVWYKDKDTDGNDYQYGRGVGNRLRDPSDSNSENLTQRLGRWFLSTRFPKPDQESLQLRRELHQLANDPIVPIRPSLQRDDEDYIERVQRLNGMPFEDAQAKIMDIAKRR